MLQAQTASAGSLQNVSFDLFSTDRLLNTYTELLVAETSADNPQLAAGAANALAIRLVEHIRQNLSQRFDAAREALRLRVDGIEERIQTARAAPGSQPESIDDLLIEHDSLVRSHNEALSLGAASDSGVSIFQPADGPTERAVGPCADHGRGRAVRPGRFVRDGAGRTRLHS